MKRRAALFGILLLGCTSVPMSPIDDDVPVTRDSGVAIDMAVVPTDNVAPVEDRPSTPPPPPPDVPAPRDVPPEPPPPLPTGGCLRFPTFNAVHTDMNPVQATVRFTSTGVVVNSQYVSLRLDDGRQLFIQQAAAFAAAGPRESSERLGVAPNDSIATCNHCALVYYNCSAQADGTYNCNNTAVARAGQYNVASFSRDASTRYISSLFNVLFQGVDSTTGATTFVRDGACFTLDELRVVAQPVLLSAPPPPPPPDAGMALPDSGTGMMRAPSEGEALRQQGRSPAPDDLVSYHACTAAMSSCGQGGNPVCRLHPGAPLGVCTSECSIDADCTSGGVCVRSAGGYFLNSMNQMRGYCFRPCLAGGCSVAGFACASVRRISDGEDASVCVPQPWVSGDPTAACTGTARWLFRECGLINRIGYTCTPGSSLTFGCVAGSAGAGCGALGTCTGDPFLRVCPGDAPCGSWGAIGHSDDECGLCPLSTVTCPPEGRVRVFAGGYDTSMPFSCFVQRR